MNNSRNEKTKRPNEGGAALLIAIFALLLISVVAIALIVSQGTESALAGNYRTSAGSHYTGVAGLEEARGRLLWKNPDYINKTNSYPNLFSGTVPAWGLTQVLYIVNPGPSEVVDPTSASPANYPDTEYGQEFSWGLGGAAVVQIPSVSPVGSASLPGPTYKWVRINPITELSLKLDVNGDGVLDGSAALYYDPAHVDPVTNKPVPSLIVPSTPVTPPNLPTPTSVEALEITALSVQPNGAQRISQYIVAPLVISPDLLDQGFSGALVLDGNGVIFQSPGSGAPNFKINGQDFCTPPPASVYSIVYTNPGDNPSVQGEVNSQTSYYPGAPMTPFLPSPGPYSPTLPSLLPIPFSSPPPPAGYSSNLVRPSWQTVPTLEAVLQDIEKNADVVINGNAVGADISTRAGNMTAANPMTIVVNGDLTLAGWKKTGYGLLLVTGTLNYDPDASWDGIVLVIGKGIFSSSLSGLGGITGAVVVAKTRDNSGNVLTTTTLGNSFFGSLTSFGSNPGIGIIYSSCWVKTAQGPLTYKVLSFREIPTN